MIQEEKHIKCLRFAGKTAEIRIKTYGPVAQLGERLVRNEEVTSSILARSTINTRLSRRPKSLIQSWTK